MSSLDALTELALLAEQRHRDPEASLRRAAELLAGSDDPQVEATAHRVMGLTRHQLGREDEAVASYRLAVASSSRHGLGDIEALARASMAISLLTMGDAEGAEREMAAARAGSSPSTRGFVEMLQGFVVQRNGGLAEALAIYQRAERWLRDVSDLPSLALVFLNRGILHAYQGNLTAALENLTEAERISSERDLAILVAMATHNIGFALARKGNFPDALAAFARAERAYAALGNPARQVAVLEADRCEVLLLAGLVIEAGAAASAAVAALAALGDLAHLTEGRLLLARALLSQGAYPEAAAEAQRAARQFGAAGRPPWAALARYVAIQAEMLNLQDQRVPPVSLLPRTRRIAAELADQGWSVESVHVRTFVGRVALALGRPAVARTELAQAVAARVRGTADMRAQAWHATALLRLAEGDRRGARRALTRGIAVVDDYRASLGATELRAHASGHGADLARLGIRLALEEDRPVEVLRWAERWRAGALRRPVIRPPDDEQLAADLADLRRVQRELRGVALRTAVGAPAAPGRGASVAALRAEAGALEEAIRQRTRQVRDDTAATGRVDIGAVRRALGTRWLVEYVEFERQLYAVTVTGTRVRLCHLGTTSDAVEEKNYLLFALRRLLSAPGRASSGQVVSATAARLDGLLVAPLGLPDDASLVVVPTGVLHGCPWSSLPSLAGRPTTVAPSAAVWLGELRPGPAPPGAGAVLVAGPDLPGADAEVSQLAELYRDATVLSGPHATAARVQAALEGANLAHLACHGCFRADSPLFSSVLLADGEMTVYDLERLRQVPATVVLAACHAASAAVHTGDELLGTASALLALGVRSVIAPVMAVPDRATAPFMVALHRGLDAGETAAAALARASPGHDRAVASAFICIGRDDAHPAAAAAASGSAHDPGGDKGLVSGADP